MIALQGKDEIKENLSREEIIERMLKEEFELVQPFSKVQRDEVNNVNLEGMSYLVPPFFLKRELPLTDKIKDFVCKTRNDIKSILSGADSRRIVIAGPCSVHNPDETLALAQEYKKISDEIGDKILFIMRVYFEKPRTTVGWGGMIKEPHLDGRSDYNEGYKRARKLLLDINELGLPVATEFLEQVTPQYVGDLVHWAAIGARTVEAPIYRHLASGLSMPVGFKNGVSGSLDVAVDAIDTALKEHSFIGVDHFLMNRPFFTRGNSGSHMILRGGKERKNYDALSVLKAQQVLRHRGLSDAVIVDCSHANSDKDYTKQGYVFQDVVSQMVLNERLIGAMLETNHNEGNQPLDGTEYGVSKTDACIGLEETIALMRYAYKTL